MHATNISLDFNTAAPLYLQLYRHIAAQIRSGALQPHQRLPGKRKLAEHLSVSVNTVDTAYQMLCAEGYLQAQPQRGFFVCPLDPALPAGEVPLVPAADPAPSLCAATPPPALDMTTGGIDTALFPYKLWGRIQRSTLSGGDLLQQG